MKYFKFIPILLMIISAGIVSCQEDDEPSAIDMTLNLQTLEGETTHGTLEAKKVENSYIGSLGEGRAIGISYLNNVTKGTHDAEQVAVFLYDGEDLAVLIGEVDFEGTGTLRAEDLSDFNASVELKIKDDTVSGTASFPEEEVPFIAQKASGNAALYWAQGTEENPDVSGYWVVLPGQRQWGCACLPPFTSPCCSLQF